MRRLWSAIAVAALSLMSGVASAADWTGFYIGANVGYSWGRMTSDFTTVGNGKTLNFSDTLSINGAIGGGQLGYNVMLSPSILAGIEADIQASGEKGSHNLLVCTSTGAAGCDTNTIYDNYNQKLHWFGTVRGRLGFLVAPNWLVYGTAGLAYGRLSRDDVYTETNGGGGLVSTVSTSFSAVKSGLAIGAGVEAALWGNFTGRVEYLYITLPSLGASSLSFQSDVRMTANRFTDNIIRFAINYRFGGGR